MNLICDCGFINKDSILNYSIEYLRESWLYLFTREVATTSLVNKCNQFNIESLLLNPQSQIKFIQKKLSMFSTNLFLI